MSLANLPIWTAEELERDSTRARDDFRAERLEEPLEDYSAFVERFLPIFRSLIDRLAEMRSGEMSAEEFVELVGHPNRLLALRYLAAPPISHDDLATLIDRKITVASIQRPEEMAMVRAMILNILDPYRFPWVIAGRAASAQEMDVSTLASATMLAAQQVQTKRRTTATKAQELAVGEVFAAAGFEEVPRRRIDHLGDAPSPGTYCGESMLGGTRADFVATLHDRRLLAIECKASNSAVNSFKRLIHEALGKAHKWRPKFGEAHLVPAVVLSGVFAPANLVAAQSGGLAIFWQFRLSDLTAFLETAKP